MGVVTTADEKLSEAKEHLDKAYKLLQQVVDPETWGYDAFTIDYINDVEESISKLRKIRRKLA